MSIFLMSQEFGGNGSARIRVRIKFFKRPVTIPRPFYPTPIGWPPVSHDWMNGVQWRCPTCGAKTGECMHVSIHNHMTCAVAS